MNYFYAEKELKKRFIYPYSWGRKQNNKDDSKTNYIYSIFNLDKLIERTEKKFKNDPNKEYYINYAINRWYNFLSAKATQEMFCSNPIVKPSENPKSRTIDFYINDIQFDLKGTNFPKNFPYSLQNAIHNKKKLINWLYDNQSREKRFHQKNRLFLVFYSSDGEHWKAKAELGLIQKNIEEYLKNFDKSKLIEINISENETILSDIIFIIK